MVHLLLILLLAAVTLLAITLLKTYSQIPTRELKRRASKGDELAKMLYRAAGYGVSLEVLLWIIIGLAAAGFFVLLNNWVPGWLAFMGAVALLWVGFAWLPRAAVTSFSQKVAKTVAPVLEWILKYTAPLISRIAQFFRHSGRVSIHTGLYQKDDLIDLLDKQNLQLDSRITADELKLAQHALTFDDHTVSQVMTPRRVVKSISAEEQVGPVLLDELHKSGFSRFPVYEGKQDHIVGTLYLRSLLDKQATGKVSHLMSKRVYYVNEEKSLNHVLDAFIKTKHHLFIVVNSFEEISGVITIEDVLEQLIGRRIVDEFDRYDDLRAVAALEARKEQKAHKHPVEDAPAEPTEDKPEE